MCEKDARCEAEIFYGERRFSAHVTATAMQPRWLVNHEMQVHRLQEQTSEDCTAFRSRQAKLTGVK
jgi:hypothetical protein